MVRCPAEMGAGSETVEEDTIVLGKRDFRVCTEAGACCGNFARVMKKPKIKHKHRVNTVNLTQNYVPKKNKRIVFCTPGEGDKFRGDARAANGGGDNAQLAPRGTSTQKFYRHRDRLRCCFKRGGANEGVGLGRRFCACAMFPCNLFWLSRP